MARPLRIEYPGACYHVINRGNQRSTVFYETGHYELFVEKLGVFAKQYDISVYCYCLMRNHFHIYLQTRQANLSRFMQTFLTSFTVTMNRRRRVSGHIFQGRFKAQLVEDELYRSKLSRYIHLNPVRMKSVAEYPLDEKLNHLKTFAWSSFPNYIGIRKTPAWMDVEPVLSTWGKSKRAKMKNYREYVEAGLLRDIESPFEDIREQSIIGSDSFVDWARREFLLIRDADTREQPTLNHLRRSFPLVEVSSIVATVFDVDAEEIFRRKSPNRLARRVLMYCACKYCSHDCSLTAIAKSFSVSISGLTRVRDRVKDGIIQNKELRKALREVESKIENGSPKKSIA